MTGSPALGPHGLPRGPAIVAPPLWTEGGEPGHPLSDEECALLSSIATVVRYRKGATLYRRGDRAEAIFNIITGVVKSYNELPNRKQQIVGFLFPNDLIGLARNGRYLNSATAVTAVSLYRIPTPALEARLRSHPGLDFQIIAKLCCDLHAEQLHASLLGKQRAIAKVAFFIQMLETQQGIRERHMDEVYVPMTRTDIGAYVGLSPEAVGRSLRDLVSGGAISFRNRQHIAIVDRARLEAVSETDMPLAVPPPGAAD